MSLIRIGWSTNSAPTRFDISCCEKSHSDRTETFSEHAMARRVNSDLANGIGNLLSRTLTMIDRNCEGTIP